MKKHELYCKLRFSDRPLISDDVFDIVYRRLERRVPKKTFKSIPQENVGSRIDALIRMPITGLKITSLKKRIKSGILTVEVFDAVLKGLQ